LLSALHAIPCAGNGKTLRTERAMRVFVEGWVHMSGPSSAKSGMQGALPTPKQQVVRHC